MNPVAKIIVGILASIAALAALPAGQAVISTSVAPFLAAHPAISVISLALVKVVLLVLDPKKA
jgi:predicted thioredoxin/glutaredoxin